MLQIETSEARRFVGLKPSVLYRIELGFAVVDDGDRLIRVLGTMFERVLSDTLIPSEDIGGELLNVVQDLDTVFELFENLAEAKTSLLEKEI